MADGTFSDDALIAQLRRINPVSAAELAGAVREPRAVMLFEEILLGAHAPVPWWRRLRQRAGASAPPVGLDRLVELRRQNPYPQRALSGARDEPRAAMIFHSIVSGEREQSRARLRRMLRAEGRVGDAALDPVALLRSVNPAPQSSVAGAGASMRAERLYAAIVAGDTAPIAPPWWRRRRILIPAVGALAIASAAAGFALSSAPPTRSGFVNCYSRANLQSTKVYVSTDGSTPTGACQAIWQQGTFGGTGTPPLVTCVLSNGAVGVFPGDNESLCASLDLPSALSPTKTAKSVAAMTVDLNAKLNATSCLGADDALIIVRADLKKHRLSNWTVAVEPSPPSVATCATAVVDAGDDTINVVFVPPISP